MTVSFATPRYSSEDLDAASIRSAAPSYISEAPSYHSTLPHSEAAPAYSPRTERAGAAGRSQTTAQRQQTIGLPPIPAIPSQNVPSLHSFRLPTWSTQNAPAARQYRNVAERRISDGRYNQAVDPIRRYTGMAKPEPKPAENQDQELRPLEDPYLVGETAAAQARRERISRETGEDILQREDKQWDWLLAQMKTWEERERSWARFRRETDFHQRKKLFHRGAGHWMP